MYYSKSPHAWALPTEWLKMLETVPSIIRNKVNQPVDAHTIASPSSADLTSLAHNSSLIIASAKLTDDQERMHQVPNNQYECISQNQNASNQNPVTNKQSKFITVTVDSTAERKIISYERDRADNTTISHNNYRKPSSESDRKLYNKQLQIITNTMEASASSQAIKCRSQQLQQQQQLQQSQIRAVFQRYSENDEFSLAMCDAYSGEEFNNNRALI